MATSTPSAPDSREPLNARDRPLQPDKDAPKGANGVGGIVQSSSRKLDSPAQLSRRLSPHSVVAKTETATPTPEAEKALEAPAEQAPPEAPPAPTQQPANPLTHAFSYIVGALGPATVKGVNSEGQPVQLADYASLGNAPAAGNSAPTSAGAGASSGPPAAVDTLVGAAPVVAPALVAPQFTDPKTKPSGRVVVAKIETPAPGPEAEKAPEAPPAPAQQPSHPFSNILGAPEPANQTATHKTGDWAMQFAAEKSEAEAKIKVARLNARYAAALNGATIGVQKTLVNGETIYALRVTGLSKADAAALCDRLKGRDCFIVR